MAKVPVYQLHTLLGRMKRLLEAHDLAGEDRDWLSKGVAEIEAAINELEDAELNTAVKWLEQRWGLVKCPYCGEGPWEVGAPMEFVRADGLKGAPMFPVMCSHCGHTTFVNAIQSEVVDEKGMLDDSGDSGDKDSATE